MRVVYRLERLEKKAAKAGAPACPYCLDRRVRVLALASVLLPIEPLVTVLGNRSSTEMNS